MGRPKKVVADIDNTKESTTTSIELGAVGGIVPIPTKVYLYPETREDYLALHKLLKDLGVNSISDLEVKASRL